jgi:hypothetical protein
MSAGEDSVHPVRISDGTCRIGSVSNKKDRIGCGDVLEFSVNLRPGRKLRTIADKGVLC